MLRAASSLRAAFPAAGTGWVRRLATVRPLLPPLPQAPAGQAPEVALPQYDSQGDMTAVVFEGPRDLRVRRKPRPQLQAGTVSGEALAQTAERCGPAPPDLSRLQDAIVQVSLSSICGSDMHPWAGRGVALDKVPHPALLVCQLRRGSRSTILRPPARRGSPLATSSWGRW